MRPYRLIVLLRTLAGRAQEAVESLMDDAGDMDDDSLVEWVDPVLEIADAIRALARPAAAGDDAETEGVSVGRWTAELRRVAGPGQWEKMTDQQVQIAAASLVWHSVARGVVIPVEAARVVSHMQLCDLAAVGHDPETMAIGWMLARQLSREAGTLRLALRTSDGWLYPSARLAVTPGVAPAAAGSVSCSPDVDGRLLEAAARFASNRPKVGTADDPRSPERSR